MRHQASFFDEVDGMNDDIEFAMFESLIALGVCETLMSFPHLANLSELVQSAEVLN